MSGTKPLAPPSQPFTDAAELTVTEEQEDFGEWFVSWTCALVYTKCFSLWTPDQQQQSLKETPLCDLEASQSFKYVAECSKTSSKCYMNKLHNLGVPSEGSYEQFTCDWISNAI